MKSGLKRSTCAFLISALPVLLPTIGNAAPRDAMALVANMPFSAALHVKNQQVQLNGRMSFHLTATQEQIRAGIVRANAANFVLGGVQQELLSGKKPKGPSHSAVGAALRTMGNQQHILKYDERKKTLEGRFPVSFDFPQLDELIPPKPIDEDAKGHDTFRPNTQKGVIQIHVQLDRPLSEAFNSERAEIKAITTASLTAEPMQDGGAVISNYTVDIAAVRGSIISGYLQRYEVGQNLCVQPVRVKSSAADGAPTGAGLAFGIPGANTHWGKADVTFTVRPWKEVINSNWKTPSTDARETDLRASVQDADCIEVFFVQNFVPESKYGGGATWGSGTASAQIISSDGNAVGGIDLTHLAHELGHVLNFKHPGTAATGMTTASSGTLMCPSGWRNDNPRINSAFNADHVSNPLLTFTLKLRGAGPDCTNNADCGACP